MRKFYKNTPHKFMTHGESYVVNKSKNMLCNGLLMLRRKSKCNSSENNMSVFTAKPLNRFLWMDITYFFLDPSPLRGYNKG